MYNAPPPRASKKNRNTAPIIPGRRRQGIPGKGKNSGNVSAFCHVLRRPR